MSKLPKEVEDQAVTLFREYLKIKTVHPEPDYGKYTFVLHQFRTKIDCPLLFKLF